METNRNRKSRKVRSETEAPKTEIRTELPLIQNIENCDFHGYDADTLMKETAKLRKIITKRGTLEILIPLCCTTMSAAGQIYKIQEYHEGF